VRGAGSTPAHSRGLRPDRFGRSQVEAGSGAVDVDTDFFEVDIHDLEKPLCCTVHPGEVISGDDGVFELDLAARFPGSHDLDHDFGDVLSQRSAAEKARRCRVHFTHDRDGRYGRLPG